VFFAPSSPARWRICAASIATKELCVAPKKVFHKSIVRRCRDSGENLEVSAGFVETLWLWKHGATAEGWRSGDLKALSSCRDFGIYSEDVDPGGWPLVHRFPEKAKIMLNQDRIQDMEQSAFVAG
jgi:hypothetical protein